MWAIVKDHEVVQVVSGDQSIMLGDTRHSTQIFSKAWTDEERKAIGIYPVELDAERDPNFWWVTDTEYAIARGRVIARRTWKPHDLDEVKARMKKAIRKAATDLITHVMPRYEQQNTVAEMCIFLMAVLVPVGEKGKRTEAHQPTDGDRERMAEIISKWRYVEDVRAYARELTAKLEALKDMEQVEALGLKDGWPLPNS